MKLQISEHVHMHVSVLDANSILSQEDLGVQVILLCSKMVNGISHTKS